MNSRYEEGIVLLENFQTLVGEDNENYAVAEQYRKMFEDVIRLQAENAEKTDAEGETAEGAEK